MSENIEARPYKVLVLGLQASGKTTLLASMSRTLSILRAHIGFRLVAEHDSQRAELNRIYESLITDKDFLPGTAKTTEWLFNCHVHSSKDKKKSFGVLDVSYIDYAGGMLDENGSGTEASEKFLEHIDSADTFLFILDGHKILNLMHDAPNADAFLYHDLFTVLQKTQSKGIPMHFVITKWDVLKAAGYTLSRVKERLLANNDFSDVVAGRDDIVRLIPVSAVGDNFARLEGDNMVKMPNRGAPVPYLVEIPLACTLVDQFNSQVRQHINSRRGELHAQPFPFLRPREVSLEVLIRLAGGAAQFLQTVEKINPVIMGGAIGATTLLELYANWEKPRRNRIKEIKSLRELRDRSLIAIQNQQEAVDSAILSCTMLVKQFEHQYPDSVLDPRAVRAQKEMERMK